MRGSFYYLVAAGLLVLSGCNEKGQNNGSTEVVHDTVYVTEANKESQDSKAEKLEGPTGVIPAEELPSGEWGAEGAFANVRKWVVTVTAVTTIYEPVSPAEARRIEREYTEDDDYWVDYDEEEQCYYLHGHAMVETDKKTITNPKHVNRLNALMANPDYKEYRDEVTIRNNTAYARWYGGNRGGGIDEDFPSDLVKLFF